MELATFEIPSFRKETIIKRLEKLAKKALKYGNGDISYSFGKPFVREVKTESGKRKVEYLPISVEGEAPQVGGYQLLARIELLGEENLVHTVPGSGERAEGRFRTHNGHCDHCNTLRPRNDVYVLTDGSEQIVVGRTCLRDFLGIDDPKSIVNRAQFFEELRSFEEEDEFSTFGSAGFFDLHELLLLAAASIRENGYVSRAKQAETGCETTGDFVAGCLKGLPNYSIKHTDEDREWVVKTLNFFREAETFDSDYLENIRILMKEDIVNPKHIALLASAVITAQRELAKEELAEASQSEFVGEVKERLRGIELTLAKVIFLGVGQFGSTYLHIMEDEKGNSFAWFTGNKIEQAEGTRVVLDATVKEHKVYNGINQTVLTRAKVK